MIDLEGRVALVTGASRGIGRACAITLAKAGADVVVNYLNSTDDAKRVAQQVQALGRRAFLVKADVRESEDVFKMMEFVEQRVGQLDILISNVAGGGFRQLVEAELIHFRAAMETNVMPTLELVQAARTLLSASKFGGKVVALSSHGSSRAIPSYGLIGASKAALESLMRHLALELGPQGIGFNTVLAGLVETDSTRSLPDYQAFAKVAQETMLLSEPELKAEDVANAVLFLCSSLASKIQGQVMVVDGGSSLRI